VSFRYPGAPRPALEKVGFSLQPGERVALLGANGAGKSTLLLACAGLLPVQGEVFANGIPHSERDAFWRQLGLVMQDPDDQLFLSTVIEDVCFGPQNAGFSREESLSKARTALAAVGAESLAERPPSQLSGGEKRRVALATVLAYEPGVLLLDEPTGGLDPRGRRQLLALLEGFSASLLLVTHDFEFAARLCARSLLLAGGQIVADRPTRDLLQDEALLAEHGL
jgi:energy-coupling factor transporter ATP-binding protein EcfA2